MHGFINSPALAKLVALQMVDEQLQQSKRQRPRKVRTALRARLQSRRTAPSAVTPAKGQRRSPAGTPVVEEAR
jgi:hypothetical protein